jgi:hypothetical protein
MGICGSSVKYKEEKKISDKIDRQIEEDSKKFRTEYGILLLGTDRITLREILANNLREI